MANPKQADMEVLKSTALGYFARSTTGEKQLAHESFDKIDADGNGRITLAEFLKILDEAEGAILEEKGEEIEQLEKLFKYIDTNGDGTLDFHEFLTFFLMAVFGGFLFCDGCSNLLVNIYFSCFECHLKTNNSYDLRIDCYRRENFSHSHSDFLDNFSLLRLYKFTLQSQPGDTTSEDDQPSVDETDDAPNVNERGFTESKSNSSMRYTKTGVEIGALAANAGLCTIM